MLSALWRLDYKRQKWMLEVSLGDYGIVKQETIVA